MLSFWAFFKQLCGLVAAGTSTQTFTFDRQGFDGARVLLQWGVVVDACTMGLKVQQGDLANGSDAADITNASLTKTASTSSGEVWSLDVYQPTKRYLTVVITRGAQNATIQACSVDMYDPRNEPVALTNFAKSAQIFCS